MATRNGRDLVKKIYYKDPDVGRNATREAGPDYDYIVLSESIFFSLQESNFSW